MTTQMLYNQGFR